jgi:aminocarboxymuconate-semialdehyde decarboxylase
MPAETSLAICSLIFGGVLDRLPNLKVAFAHAGGSFPATIGRIEHGWSCRPDLCATDCKTNPRDFLGTTQPTPVSRQMQRFSPTAHGAGRFWVDSLTHDPACLKHVVDLFGEDKVALGTDYPFPRTPPAHRSLRMPAHS